MPSRIVREGILDSELVNALSDESELLYRRMMSIVDDFGRFEDKPEVIRARCFSLKLEDWPLEKVERCLSDVSKLRTCDGQMSALVSRYSVNGKKYLQINNFGQRTRAAKYPPPSDDGHVTVTRRPKSESESESGIVVEGVVERGASDQFFVDEGYRDFADLYRPLKDYGLQGVAPMHAYLDLVSESPNAAIIHGRIMAGVGRMALSGRPRQFFPTAENFLKKKLYMDDWAPEEPVGASKGPRSAYEEMKEMGI